MGGGAAGGFGYGTCLCTVKPNTSIRSGCQYRYRGWGRGGYTSAGAGMQEGHEELCASTLQGHDELYADTQQGHDELYAGTQQHEEFVIMRHFVS